MGHRYAHAMPRLTHFARLALALIFACVAAFAAHASSESGDSFGKPIELTETTPLGDVVAAPAKFEARRILLRGRIADVCQKKGCWTVLQQGDATLRVRFADYGFFLPKDCQGRQALVEGVVSVRTLSEREAKHYARESVTGDPEAIEGPQREVGFVASGVRLLPRD